MRTLPLTPESRQELNRKSRRGESLAEMVVVMSVIVGMASMSWPTIRNSLSKSQLQSAAKQVSADLSKARLTAIQTGVPQEFRFQVDQNAYEIAPRMRVTAHAAAAGVESATEDSEDSEDAIQHQLADGLKFIIAKPEEEAAPQETILASADATWSEPIIFYPNGRASQAAFELEGDQGMRVEIKLNSMTGTPKLGSLQKPE